jgi:hypothetical protein
MRALFTIGFLILIFGVEPNEVRGDCQASPPISLYRPIKLKTLGDARQKYLGQQVVIVGGLDSVDPTGPELYYWDVADPKALKKGRYEPGRKKLPKSYLGRNGVVVALDVALRLPSMRSQPATNALGETIGESAEDISTSPVNVVVRFDDGVVAVNQALLTDMDALDSTPFELATIAANHAQLMQNNLSSVVGRELYPVSYSWVYPVTASIEDLDTVNLIKRVKDYPYLEPATLVAARYVKEFDIVVLKLRLHDGSEVLTSSKYRDEDTEVHGPAADNSFLGRISGNLLTMIPSSLTKEEVAAVQRGEIFKGMSRRAAEYVEGRTSTENDWGSGGLQLVYGKRLFVYLDNSCKVADWQFLSAAQ